MVVIRFADDTIAGFQYQTDADHFLENLRERLGKFGLELHPDKTRRIEFGRFAEQNRPSGSIRGATRNGCPYRDQRVCELDLEGIVAKEKSARYLTEREHSTWCKLNREYSQRDGRKELFERERHSEAVAGWHLRDFNARDPLCRRPH